MMDFDRMDSSSENINIVFTFEMIQYFLDRTCNCAP